MQLSLQTINWVAMPHEDQEVPCATAPLEEVLDAAVAAGFQHVGLDHVTITQQNLSNDAVEKLLQARDLGCTDIGILSVSAAEGATQARVLGQLAAQVGATTCITVVSEPPEQPVIDNLIHCAQILQEYGVRMALEFVPYGPITTLRQCVEICDRIGWEQCGILLDTWHLFHNRPAWDLLESLDANQIALIHINDAPPAIGDDLAYESRFRRVPPGYGEFDYPRFLAALRVIGYDGILSPEVLSTAFRSQEPRSAARELHAATLKIGIMP